MKLILALIATLVMTGCATKTMECVTCSSTAYVPVHIQVDKMIKDNDAKWAKYRAELAAWQKTYPPTESIKNLKLSFTLSEDVKKSAKNVTFRITPDFNANSDSAFSPNGMCYWLDNNSCVYVKTDVTRFPGAIDMAMTDRETYWHAPKVIKYSKVDIESHYKKEWDARQSEDKARVERLRRAVAM